MWDYDRFGANEFLGEVCLDLGSMLAATQDEDPVWHALSLGQNGFDGVRRILQKNTTTFSQKITSANKRNESNSVCLKVYININGSS